MTRPLPLFQFVFAAYYAAVYDEEEGAAWTSAGEDAARDGAPAPLRLVVDNARSVVRPLAGRRKERVVERPLD